MCKWVVAMTTYKLERGGPLNMTFISVNADTDPNTDINHKSFRKLQRARCNLYLVNKLKLRFTPIEKHSPTRNRMFPMAIIAASKKRITPSTTKPSPRVISPTPIFWLSSNTMMRLILLGCFFLFLRVFRRICWRRLANVSFATRIATMLWDSGDDSKAHLLETRKYDDKTCKCRQSMVLPISVTWRAQLLWLLHPDELASRPYAITKDELIGGSRWWSVAPYRLGTGKRKRKRKAEKGLLWSSFPRLFFACALWGDIDIDIDIQYRRISDIRIYRILSDMGYYRSGAMR